MNVAPYAYRAGFRGDALRIAVAIAYAESGGDPTMYNPETAAGTPAGMGSVGLWQIYRKAHPDLANLNLTDPQVNANAAMSVFRQAGGSFYPWATYQHGSYIPFLPRADQEIAALGPADKIGVVPIVVGILAAAFAIKSLT